MITELTIKNLILMEETSLHFSKGLHVFSGETGAGKTAILQALQLLLGARFEQNLLRKGQQVGSIEAFFDLPLTSQVFNHLEESEIEVDPSEPLHIKRTFTAAGKTKLLINHQWAPLYLLKKLSSYLLEIISQHASQDLLDISTHRDFLDLYASHFPLLNEVKNNYQDLKSLEEQINQLTNEHKQSIEKKKQWQEALDEIESVKIQSENEEEKLFQEYELLSHAKERILALSEITHLLCEEDSNLTDALVQITHRLKKLSHQDAHLVKAYEALKSATEEIKEQGLELISYRDQIEEDPKRLTFLEERLSTFSNLKKRYGSSLKEVLDYLASIKEQQINFDEFDQKLKQLLDQKKALVELYQNNCKQLTKSRKNAATQMQKALKEYFVRLNLKDAELEIRIDPGSLTEWGQDQVEYYLKANLGEHPAALKKRASGGELARVLLSLKLLLASKSETPTLVFDEIDAHLGGETAPKMGELLQKASQDKQIISITHLPQVAVFADHHYKIEKQVHKDRTLSLVEKLNKKARVLEIERMLGGKELSEKAKELAQDLIDKD